MTTPTTAAPPRARETEKVPVSTIHSGTNPLRPGRAMEASPLTRKVPATSGMTRAMPPSSLMATVPVRRAMKPVTR